MFNIEATYIKGISKFYVRIDGTIYCSVAFFRFS